MFQSSTQTYEQQDIPFQLMHTAIVLNMKQMSY